MSDGQNRPLRADAARNRARLLDVAATVFAERGVGVTTEEIARAAGVGVGTLFRHFPTKEALLAAVLARRMEQVVARGGELAERAEPAEAFFGTYRLIVEQSAGKEEFSRALTAAGVDVHQALGATSAAVRALLERLLAGAQRAGAVRTGLDLTDLVALLLGTASAMDQLGPDPAARERVLQVVFDGLRPPRD
ncbi:TetR/AcrR family transcriptional regulator [Kitasatospora sp. NPDC006697]|uniref:TetR/AcrR family transcriptional regulator n=1 Tax=Kitasatospora sp. NPDC006697 TaxID=3364020 RepID=UPI0036811C4F